MNLDYIKYRAKYHYARWMKLKAPVDIMLELSSTCDLHCDYCYHSDKKNLPFRQKHMKADVAYKILDEAARLGVNSLKFNYRGEGTLNPNYYPIAKIAMQMANGSTFIDRIVNSNFNFIKDREEILEALCFMTKVKVSFDSFNHTVFEKQRAGAKFDNVLKNIDDFYHHPMRKDTEIVIQCVRTRLNINEDFKALAQKRWPGVTVSIRDVVGGRKKDNIDEYEFKKRDSDNRKPCKQAYARLIFTWDGIALPCCPDIKEQIVLGDIKTTSMKSIFNSFIARELRRDLKNGMAFTLDPCKSCSSFESYKGGSVPWNS